MKTQKEKELNDQIRLVLKELDTDYKRLKDFSLLSNKTDVVLKRMADNSSLIKAIKNKIAKLNA